MLEKYLMNFLTSLEPSFLLLWETVSYDQSRYELEFYGGTELDRKGSSVHTWTNGAFILGGKEIFTKLHNFLTEGADLFFLGESVQL